jgi:hypothetical protein
MTLKHALATGAATLSMAAAGLAVGAQPASAATSTWGTPTYGLTCTYDLDEVAHTLDGTCTGRTPLGTATATFQGSYGGDFAFRMPALYIGHGAPPLLDDPVWSGQLAAWAATCRARRRS